MYSQKAIKLSGLTPVGKDALGIPQYIGTKEQWMEADKVDKEKSGAQIARRSPETMEDSQQSDRELYDDDRNNLK